ncbi:MAG: hypothetical protein FJ025_01170 [Chloroflexi bacterium]|nr:hypothetical protein [Chloroflexota bacterium]
MVNEFDEILNECLERLATGETIDQCLQSYPEQADELRPLLQTALVVKKASAIQPRPEFKARARYQFRSALQEAASRKSRPVFGWLPHWATVTAIVIGILLLGSGVVAASGYSMPDSPLYSLKIATENAQIALTRSDLGKAELNAKFADRRVTEIVYLANKGYDGRIDDVTQRLDEDLTMLASRTSAGEAAEAPKALMAPAPTIAPTPAPVPPQAPLPEEEPVLGMDSGSGRGQLNKQDELKVTVEQSAADNIAALQAALDKAPESAKPALQRAIAIAEERYQRAIEALE